MPQTKLDMYIINFENTGIAVYIRDHGFNDDV